MLKSLSISIKMALNQVLTLQIQSQLVKRDIPMKEQVRLEPSPEDQCSICLVKCTKPVKCKGPCQKLFCLKCAAQAKCNDDRCPNRCSSPFLVDTLTLPLRCPFNPRDCVMSISSEQDLKNHYLICPHVSSEQKQAIDNRLNYKCNKGHNLTFLPRDALTVLYGKYWASARIECVSCHQMELCRAMCLSCSLKEKQEVYCSDCRTPPCTKQKCPMGHKLKNRSKPGKYRFCDFCDVPAGLLSSKVYGFCSCDFDLCELCHRKLPDTSDKIPLKCNVQRLWPFSLVEQDSDDSDWKE